jgi:hypothetical protein
VRLDPVNRDCATGVLTNNPDANGVPQGFTVFGNNFSLFPWVAEDRVFGPSGSEVTSSVVERAVRCGMGVVFLDDFATSTALQNPSPVDFRHWRGIWSWEPGDMGDRGAAVVLKGQKTAGAGGAWNYWNSRNTTEVHRFLCGTPRSESGADPVNWADRAGNNWRVTNGAGSWAEGGFRCLEEFGDGWVFRVPVSGYQNVQASLAADGAGDVWLNYNDIEDSDEWVINQRPFAAAGPDQTLECTANGAVARLDGSASHDPERHPLKFLWTGDAAFSTNPVREVFVPVGGRTLTLVVDDHFSGVRADSMLVSVQDTTAPVIQSAVPSRSTLGPPNGKMVPVSFTVVATDTCSANLNTRIVLIDSSEANILRGSSVNNGADAEITAPLTAMLRAERLGTSSGRIYTITIRSTDPAGNSTDKKVAVTVPHDQR